MNENKKELIENELEMVAGGILRQNPPEKDLSDEDKEKLKELEKQIADKM
jgi:hypothetical protein